MVEVKSNSELFQEIKKHFIYDKTELSPECLRDYQLLLVRIQNEIKTELSTTSTKDLHFEDAEVIGYINKILTDGFNLKETQLSDVPSMIEAQNLSKFKSLIKVCVESSPFSQKDFGIKALRHQRSNIESAKNLHCLRQAIKEIIPVLQMHRQFESLQKNEDAIYDSEMFELTYYLQENERLQKICDERERVISEITSLYDSVDIVKQVAVLKKEHGCTDAEACKVLKISTSTLKRAKSTRKEEVTQ